MMTIAELEHKVDALSVRLENSEHERDRAIAWRDAQKCTSCDGNRSYYCDSDGTIEDCPFCEGTGLSHVADLLKENEKLRAQIAAMEV